MWHAGTVPGRTERKLMSAFCDADQPFLSVLDVGAKPGRPSSAEGPPWQTVSNVQVHKRNRLAVRPTRWRNLEKNCFEVEAGWAHYHPIYQTDAQGGPDLLLAAETLRQCVVLIAHAGYGVPLDSAFVMRGISLRLLDASHRDAEPLAVTVTCQEVRRRRGQLQGMRIELSFRQGARLAAVGTGDLLVLPASIYPRIRSGRITPQEAVAYDLMENVRVGKDRAQDVLLSFRDPVWTLQPDTTHPVLFDHPCDHVPGMLLLEAARQVAYAALDGFRPSSLVATFQSYVEFQPAPQLAVTRTGSQACLVRVLQGGADVCLVELRG